MSGVLVFVLAVGSVTSVFAIKNSLTCKYRLKIINELCQMDIASPNLKDKFHLDGFSTGPSYQKQLIDLRIWTYKQYIAQFGVKK